MSKPRKPRTELYLRSDITAVLAAVAATVDAMSDYANSPRAQTYRAGMLAALEAVAKGFDVHVPLSRPAHRQKMALSAEWADALPDDWQAR